MPVAPSVAEIVPFARVAFSVSAMPATPSVVQSSAAVLISRLASVTVAVTAPTPSSAAVIEPLSASQRRWSANPVCGALRTASVSVPAEIVSRGPVASPIRSAPTVSANVIRPASVSVSSPILVVTSRVASVNVPVPVSSPAMPMSVSEPVASEIAVVRSIVMPVIGDDGADGGPVERAAVELEAAARERGGGGRAERERAGEAGRDDAEVAVEVGDADLAAGDREAVAGFAELDVEVVEAERQQLAGADGLQRRGEAAGAGDDAAEVELGERAVDAHPGRRRERLEAGGGERAGLVGVDLRPVERRRAAVDVEADAGQRGAGERAEVQRAGEARALGGDPAAAVGGGDDRDPGAAARQLEAADPQRGAAERHAERDRGHVVEVIGADRAVAVEVDVDDVASEAEAGEGRRSAGR